MKVIFLDFDGVLNHDNWPPPHKRYKIQSLTGVEMLDPTCVARLNEIIARTGARCVISSTWRTVTPWYDLQKTLNRAGFDGLVIGQTVDNEWRTPRGTEIEAWVESNMYPEDTFIILDDRNDMAPNLDRLVQTDERFGLTQENVEEAVRLLST